MCLDRRTLRSVAAHKGWATRRARMHATDQSAADPFEVGGLCITRKRDVPEALDLSAHLTEHGASGPASTTRVQTHTEV